MMNPDTRQVPYGVADFELIRRDNLYYVDKTMYLPMLETEARNIFFTRPRRFGKSLLINMLHAYYDCNKKDKFEQLFGDLWIGKHPTSLQGKYLVLYLDFSQVGGSIDQVEEKFNAYCGTQLNGFVRDYERLYPKGLFKKLTVLPMQVPNLTKLPTSRNAESCLSTLSSTSMTILPTPYSTSKAKRCTMLSHTLTDFTATHSKGLRETLSAYS